MLQEKLRAEREADKNRKDVKELPKLANHGFSDCTSARLFSLQHEGKGHKVPDCPNRVVFCFLCGGKGQKSPDCPENKTKVNLVRR